MESREIRDLYNEKRELTGKRKTRTFNNRQNREWYPIFGYC